eukprot:1560200-Pleurochrysis_carterae.AAC.1
MDNQFSGTIPQDVSKMVGLIELCVTNAFWRMDDASSLTVVLSLYTPNLDVFATFAVEMDLPFIEFVR